MRPMNQILCPIDLSDVSRHAIEHAVLLAGWWRSSIAALHVWNPIVIPSTDFTLVGMPTPADLGAENITDLRRQVAACFPPPGINPDDVFIQCGQPAKQIVATAAAL